jgi:hydroxyacylglutathione hydrolase
VGGGPDAAPIRASVMDTLMTLPHEVRVLPGHTDETTIGREWEENPFVRYWRGDAASIDEAVRVGGEDATLLVWSPDYDGKGKAMVRFSDGREAIIGGSRVER